MSGKKEWKPRAKLKENERDCKKIRESIIAKLRKLRRAINHKIIKVVNNKCFLTIFEVIKIIKCDPLRYLIFK